MEVEEFEEFAKMFGDGSVVIGCTFGEELLPDFEIVDGEIRYLDAVESEAISVLVNKQIELEK